METASSQEAARPSHSAPAASRIVARACRASRVTGGCVSARLARASVRRLRPAVATLRAGGDPAGAGRPGPAPRRGPNWCSTRYGPHSAEDASPDAARGRAAGPGGISGGFIVSGPYLGVWATNSATPTPGDTPRRSATSSCSPWWPTTNPPARSKSPRPSSGPSRLPTSASGPSRKPAASTARKSAAPASG